MVDINVQKSLTTDANILSVSDVVKTFEGVCALDRVSFNVPIGQIKALIGPNGAGKTTLLNVINGLLSPDYGHVYFDGRPIDGLKPDQIALLGVSRTFQLIKLFTVNDATVLDNVMVGAHKKLDPSILHALFVRPRMNRQEREVRDRAISLLQFVGLEWAANLPPLTLSLGNQRLLELARSLVADPKILLLDEPASGLNEAEVETFLQLLSAIREKGITILLVEHNMKLVMKVADDIVVLDFGRKLAEGHPEEICKNANVIEAYLGRDFVRCKD